MHAIVVTDPHTNKPTDRTDYNTLHRSLARRIISDFYSLSHCIREMVQNSYS